MAILTLRTQWQKAKLKSRVNARGQPETETYSEMTSAYRMQELFI